MELDHLSCTSQKQKQRYESEERDPFMGEEQDVEDASAGEVSGFSNHPHPDHGYAANLTHAHIGHAYSGTTNGASSDPYSGTQPYGHSNGNGPSSNSGAQYSHAGPAPGVPLYGGVAATSAEPWISQWLRLPFIAGAVSATLALQGAITGLSIDSAKNHGIADVAINDNGRQFFTFQVSMAMLWTFLPTLLLQGYGLLYGAVVKAACARQPFVELLKHENDGAAPEKSILLDYTSWILPWAVIKALKYGHFMLFWAQLASLLALLLGPFGSHLFQAASVSREKSVAVIQSSSFDDNAFDVVTGLSPALDIVSATKLYGAQPIPWTTNNTSLLSFRLSGSVPQGQLANVSVQTKAYATYLDCVPLQPPNYTLIYDSSGGGAWYFSANDRGCDFGGSGQVLFTSGFTAAVKTFAETYRADCNNDVGSSRIIIAIALNVDGSMQTFSNASVVSCIPSYATIEGKAQLAYTGSTDFNLVSYDVTQNSSRSNPLFAANFESGILQPRIIGSSNEQATKLGDIIIQNAKNQAPTNYLDGVVLIDVTRTIITTAFNVMVQTMLVQSSNTKQIEATISQQQDRLVVVLPVAYTILGILMAILIALIWVSWYTSCHKEAQFEEYKGLVGPAVVLHKGALDAEVVNRKASSHDGRIAEEIAYDLTHSQRVGWKIEHWPDPRRTVLTTTTKARPVKWFRP